MQLVIGNPNYSTWSLRPWLLMQWHGLSFHLEVVSLHAEGLRERLLAHSASARVPVLKIGDECIWDSLAICETVSERFLQGRGWPEDPAARAHARSVSAEMHAGFQALRNEAPMNIRARRRIQPSAKALADLARINELWAECRHRYAGEGEWLFGRFSIADCMYAPVALRLLTYDLSLPDPLAQRYAVNLQQCEAMQEWYALAREDHEIIAEDEAGEPL